jgi:hypothetical protein
MNEQLVLIRTKNGKPGCNFSRTPAADTWLINLRITDSEKFPFVCCEKCPRPACYRFEHGRSTGCSPEND